MKWNKLVSLFMIIMLLFMGVKGTYHGFCINTPMQLCCAAGSGSDVSQISEDHNEMFNGCGIAEIICSTGSIKFDTWVYATMKPSGADIYRAKIKSNGKNGKFKKIGNCNNFMPAEHYGADNYKRWTLNYEDSTVNTGNAYAYKCRVYCYYKTEEETYQYQEVYSKKGKGIAARTVGKYTCKVVKNTAKKLIVKLTGKSKHNGPLKPYIGYHNAQLRYKNEGEDEIRRDMMLIKYSYDGKKWYKYETYKESFEIKGKQSIYLYFIQYINYSDRFHPVPNIKFSNYQYVQMFFWPVNYNLQHMDRSPQIRFNLTFGTAAVNDFISYRAPFQAAFVWDGDIFERDYEAID